MSANVVGQTVDIAELDRCRQLDSEADRLACFESLIPVDEPPAGTAAAPEASQPDGNVPDAPADSGAAGQTSSGTTAVEAAAPAAAATAESGATGAPDGAPGMPATEERADDEFGREHIGGADESVPPALTATVVSVTRTWDDALVFHLDNGQVWRQIEPRRYPYPRNREFDVEITQGMMGEYRLRVGGEGRMVKVRRVE